MKKNYKKAFTIVELMLAVAFLGTLLLSIAMLTMQLINMYTKGATMRSINSTGSMIMKDIRNSVSSSSGSLRLDKADDREKYLWRGGNNDSFGAFCTGSYTYIWNYQEAMLAFRENRSEAGKNLRINNEAYALARVRDSSCNAYFNRISNTTINLRNLSAAETDYSILLDGRNSSDSSDLALYDFSVITATRSADLNQKALYDISFVLGTMRGGINVLSANNYCTQQTTSTSAQGQEYADVGMSYCAVNRFEFVARQGGRMSE